MTQKESLRDMTAKDRARDLMEILEAQARGTTHLINGGKFTTRVPLSVKDIRRMRALKSGMTEPKKRVLRPSRTSKANQGGTIPETLELVTEKLLAQRWYCSTSRLQHWRSKGEGPAYLKIAGRVLYRMSDIHDYETKHLVKPSSVITSK